MYTQCPQCDSTYRIQIPQLRMARGQVQCSHCRSVFNALLNLTENLPEIPVVAERVGVKAHDRLPGGAVQSDPVVPILALPNTPDMAAVPAFDLIDCALARDERIRAETDQAGLKSLSAGPRPGSALSARRAELPNTVEQRGLPPLGVENDHALTVHTVTPTGGIAARPFIAERSATSATSSLHDREFVTDDDEAEDYSPAPARSAAWLSIAGWSIGTLSLLVLLAGQFIYFMRGDLARYPALRPMLEVFCSTVRTVLPCDVPLRADIAQIERRDSHVRAHPLAQDALLASVTLFNNAPFRQPFPQLQLTLTDIGSKIKARRRFTPREYLDHRADIGRGMLPGVAVPVVLELAAPSIDFHLGTAQFDVIAN